MFAAELCGAYKPRHTYLRRFPLVLILAAELARFRCGFEARVHTICMGVASAAACTGGTEYARWASRGLSDDAAVCAAHLTAWQGQDELPLSWTPILSTPSDASCG